MPREGLPFKTVGEPELLSNATTVSDIFEFAPERGKKYVYKEVRPGTRVSYQYLGENLTETAVLMKTAYQILERYLGDYLVPTHFLLAKNKKGEPCIMMAQEKIEGKLVDELIIEKSLSKLPPDIVRQREEIEEAVLEAEKDPELASLIAEEKLIPGKKSRFFHEEVVFQENQIVDKSGRVRVVDW